MNSIQSGARLSYLRLVYPEPLEEERPLTCEWCSEECTERIEIEDEGDPSVGYGPTTWSVCSACVENMRRR
jgi:hypothetical protein